MKEDKAAVLLLLDPELKRKAQACAKKDDRSMNKWIAQLIKKAVEEQNNA